MNTSQYKGDRRPAEVRMDTSSGFVISIRPLPPYYNDLINDQFPMPLYPKRQITLSSGDVIPWDYTPKEGEQLTPMDEDYELWAKWHAVDEYRKEVAQDRELAKRKFLLSNCVTIIDGPYSVDDENWVQRVEAAFENYKVPEHPGKRMLVFLTTQVIASPDEMEIIIKSALHQEVTMQGIINALRGFQHQVEEANAAGGR